MEGNIDSRQWGGSKATIKLDITLRFLLGLRTFGALRDDITEHLSTMKVRQLVESVECRDVGQVLNAYLLHLEIIQDVCHCLQSYQFTSTDILLTLYVRDRLDFNERVEGW